MGLDGVQEIIKIGPSMCSREAHDTGRFQEPMDLPEAGKRIVYSVENINHHHGIKDARFEAFTVVDGILNDGDGKILQPESIQHTHVILDSDDAVALLDSQDGCRYIPGPCAKV